MDGNGKDQRGAWPDMVLRPPLQALRRSNSTHSARAPRIPIPEDHQQGKDHPAQQQAPLTMRQSGGRRSASAERCTWVAAPPTKPKAERWVPLPFPQHLEEEEESFLADQDATTPVMFTREASGTFSPTGFHDPSVGVRGRILITTSCESFRRDDVVQTLNDALPHCSLSKHPEVIHLEAHVDPDMPGRRSSVADAIEPGDVFIFDYGVVVFWGLDESAEQHVLRLLRGCQVKPLPPDEVHQEQITFHYTADQPPHIQNDCITISRREARDHLVKMAISHALAQSCKLNLYETRVGTLVEQVRHLPESLAKHGEIRMSRQKMAKIKGQVFIQKSEVNLLSTVLDTPDFFWSAPDALRALYNKVCEYNELSARADLVNSRTMLIQSMLRIWSDHKAHNHLVRLDRIIILLIIAEVVIAALEVIGFFLARKRT